MVFVNLCEAPCNFMVVSYVNPTIVLMFVSEPHVLIDSCNRTPISSTPSMDAKKHRCELGQRELELMAGLGIQRCDSSACMCVIQLLQSHLEQAVCVVQLLQPHLVWR